MRTIKGLRGKCERCGRKGKLTKHHILPKKYKGKSILVCPKCHIKLHKKEK